ncbi:MAG: MFS transporter [Candidatus Competibacteraceae bacterium]|nr:MAG: MFS transporter [Candidatus Competibacteraceae bacterium]
MVKIEDWRTPAVILWCGALILAVSLGIRHTFGLFLQPMSLDNGWGREIFAFAIALQNLVWGLAQPFAGRLADRFGAGWAILGGTLLYVAGLLLMAQSTSTFGLALSAGVLIGLGLSGTTFPVVFGAVSRAVPPEQRSLAMGIAMAIGSLGQFVLLPGSQWLIGAFGWAAALVVLGLLGIGMAPLSAALFERPFSNSAVPARPLRAILAEAFTHRGFWLLSLGFFVCGFQVVFIATHIPAFLMDRGLSPLVGTTVLALIGLFNIFGSYLAGLGGGKFRKPMLLTGIYLTRAVVITAFILLPVTAWSAYAFGMVMGLLWLSTVPLTNGTVATVFGVGNMSMLGGIVFLFHQVGAFLGGWLGGYLYDATGSYRAVWIIAIGLSLAAALLNWPIREQAVRPATAPA